MFGHDETGLCYNPAELFSCFDKERKMPYNLRSADRMAGWMMTCHLAVIIMIREGPHI